VIRGLGPIPSVWDYTALFKRIDHDCYVQIEAPVTDELLVMKVGDLETPEALIETPKELQDFISLWAPKLAFIEYVRKTDGVTCRALCGRNNPLLIVFGATMQEVRH
jgi:hypothetical protein